MIAFSITVIFLSTLSLRRATCNTHTEHLLHTFLSTLSLRRATAVRELPWIHGRISIHALLAESDFLNRRFRTIQNTHFYPRSPCGERPCRHPPDAPHGRISIHALLAESDLKTPCVRLSIDVFLSTLSLRRATEFRELLHPSCTAISIHALLAESDKESL